MTKWRLSPAIPDTLFRFEAPEGAQRVDAASLVPRQPGRSRVGGGAHGPNHAACPRYACLVATTLHGPPAGGRRLRAEESRLGSQHQSFGRQSRDASRGDHVSNRQSGNTSTRKTTAETRRGETADRHPHVTKEGDTLNINRDVQSSSGASISKEKQIQFDDGRVESVERDVTATDRYGRTAQYSGQGGARRLRLGVRRRRQEPLRPERRSGRLRCPRLLRFRRGRRRRRRTLRQPHGRRRPALRRSEPTCRSCPTAPGRTTTGAVPITATAAPTTGRIRSTASWSTATSRRRTGSTIRRLRWARSSSPLRPPRSCTPRAPTTRRRPPVARPSIRSCPRRRARRFQPRRCRPIARRSPSAARGTSCSATPSTRAWPRTGRPATSRSRDRWAS